MNKIFPALAICLAVGGESAAQNPPQNPQTPSPPQTRERKGMMPRMLFLSGKVVLDGGGPPPQRVKVNLICNGRRVRQVSTDSDGGFSLDLSSTRPPGAGDTVDAGSGLGGFEPRPDGRFPTAGAGVFQDAGPGRVDLSGCKFSLDPSAGFQANSLWLGFRRVFDKPDVGVIVLHGDKSADPVVSLNTLEADPEALKAYEEAKSELARDEIDYKKVRKNLERAVEIFPGFALAWALLGQTRLHLKDDAGARQALAKAIESDPAYPRPYLDLARLQAQAKNWTECESLTAKLIELNPEIPESYYLAGVSRYYLGQTDAAEAAFSVLHSKGAGAEYPLSFFLQGMMLARRSELPAAAEAFRNFVKHSADDESLAGVRAKVANQLEAWEEAGAAPKPRQR